MMRGRGGVVVVVAIAALATASAAQAAVSTFTVSGFGDGGGSCAPPAGTSESCPTLRTAEAAAEGVSTPSNVPTVQLDAGTYQLAGSLNIQQPMTISGAGMDGAPSGTTIEQTTAGDGVVSVNTGGGTTTFERLEITGGHETNPDFAQGGGMEIDTPVVLDSVLVTGNSAITGAATTAGTAGGYAAGGGIYEGNPPAKLTLNDSAVTDNQAIGGGGGPPPANGTGGAGGEADGGGIDALGPITVSNSTISGNTASGGAGGGSTATNISGGAGGTSAGGGIFGGGETFGAGDTVFTNNTVVTGNTSRGGAGGSAGASHTAGAGGWAYAGGAVFSGTAPSSVTDAHVDGNSAIGGAGGGTDATGATGGAGGLALGGGIVPNGPAALTLTGSTVSNNSATAAAGGVAATDGHAGAAGGGAINSGSGKVTIRSSTLASNTAAGGPASGATGVSGYGAGGAINTNAQLSVVDSTLTGNQANAGPVSGGAAGSGSYGGGIAMGAAHFLLASDTVVGNSSIGSGGSKTQGGNIVYSGSGTSTLEISDTILASGGATQVGLQNCELQPSTGYVDGGDNLEDDTTSQCGFSSARPDVLVLPGTSIVAGAPASNGGPTPTLALVPGSPALGAGHGCVDPSMSNQPLTVDQRGLPRPGTPGKCDIGAFEHQPLGGSLSATVSGSPAPGGSLRCTATGATGDLNPPTFAWLRDDAAIPGATVSTYAIATADGGHKLVCRATITGVYGGSLSATSAAVSVAPPRPVISHLRQSHRSWSRGKARAQFSGKHEKPKRTAGTTFSFSLNTAAQVTFTFTHQASRLRPGKRCVPPKRGPHAVRCTRTITDGSLTFAAATGAHKLAFDGVLGHAKLGLGSYKLIVTAVASGKRAAPRSLTFTIIRG